MATFANNPSKKHNRSSQLLTRRLIFGDFAYFPLKQQLTYKGNHCDLDPKMLLLLRLLIDARPRVLSKQQLIQELWPDAVVSDWSLSRLVSDTRKLMEFEGQQQSIIKTVRGKGFTFVANVDEIIQAYPDTNHSAHESTEHKKPIEVANLRFNKTAIKLAGLLIILLLAIFTYSVVYQSNNATSKAQIDHHSKTHLLNVMYQIQKNLRLTKTTYQAQKRRRYELDQSLIAKIPEPIPLSAEKRMRLHYKNLTEDEKFIFDQIRAMTEGPMFQGNSAILDLLDQHPELYQEIDTFHALYDHLSIWKNKFQKVFIKRKDMNVVFVGEEDGVPFPSKIDSLVSQWIANNQSRKSDSGNDSESESNSNSK